MDVSIIIVNYNTCRMTQDCIDSVYDKTSGVDFEIILIDNASTDESKEHFERLQSAGKIRYVYSYENMGFGRANNVGMMLAKGEYFFLLNSDTLLVNNAVKMFYDYVKDHDYRAFYGCWLEDAKGNTIFSGRKKVPSISSLVKSKILNYYYFFNKRPQLIPATSHGDVTEMGFITGADMFFHRSVYEELPGFDHSFFMYYEETDWQRTAHKNNIKSFLINGPRIIHFNGGSQKNKKQDPKRMVASYERLHSSQCYYIKKNTNFFGYLYFRIMDVLLSLPIFFFGRKARKGDICGYIKSLLKGYKK